MDTFSSAAARAAAACIINRFFIVLQGQLGEYPFMLPG